MPVLLLFLKPIAVMHTQAVLIAHISKNVVGIGAGDGGGDRAVSGRVGLVEITA